VKPLLVASRGASLSFAAVVVGACGSSNNPMAAAAADGGMHDVAVPDAAAADAATPDAGPPPANVDTSPVDTSTIPPETWTWVPVQGSQCRDGSATGFGISVNPQSPNLMIFLEGGGACFNALTCAMNPSSFDSSTLSSAATGGLLDRTDMANPVKDWNMVYLPFCTGDIFGGNNPNATVSGVSGVQQFVGYVNVTRFLAKLAPTFKSITKVLLTGMSAGGFGAAANYQQVARAFAPIPVYDLDDSGPPMEDPYVPKCLQKAWADLWGFDKTILADCGNDCPDPTNYTIDAVLHAARLYPKIPFGLVEDTDDSVITLFYGFGNNDCTAGFGLVPGSTFTAGLLDERTKLQAAGITNSGSFIFQGTSHTSVQTTSAFDSEIAGGGDSGPAVKLSDWVTALVNTGTVTNVGP
jgi:Pectinacetylesterase